MTLQFDQYLQMFLSIHLTLKLHKHLCRRIVIVMYSCIGLIGTNAYYNVNLSVNVYKAYKLWMVGTKSVFVEQICF